MSPSKSSHVLLLACKSCAAASPNGKAELAKKTTPTSRGAKSRVSCSPSLFYHSPVHLNLHKSVSASVSCSLFIGRPSILHPTICRLSPQLVCLLFRMIYPPICPVGLAAACKALGVDRFTKLSPSPKLVCDQICQCHGQTIAKPWDWVGENRKKGLGGSGEDSVSKR
jgi:hypothetical protein